jgi:hypothetical protein
MSSKAGCYGWIGRSRSPSGEAGQVRWGDTGTVVLNGWDGRVDRQTDRRKGKARSVWGKGTKGRRQKNVWCTSYSILHTLYAVAGSCTLYAFST